MQRVPSYTTESYSYYHVDEQRIRSFGNWWNKQDLTSIYNCDSSTDMVRALHTLFDAGMQANFEYKTRNKKSSEPCWMADWIRDLIKDRRRVFRTDGRRSARWRDFKKKTSKIVRSRRSKYNQQILTKFREDNNPGNFFKHVDGLLGNNNKPRWSLLALFPGSTPKQTAEKMATFFNSISSEYPGP